MTNVGYGVRIIVKLAEGVIAGDSQFSDTYPETLEQAERMALEIASSIGEIEHLMLTDPENPKVYIILSKDVLSRHPVFVSAFSKKLHATH